MDIEYVEEADLLRVQLAEAHAALAARDAADMKRMHEESVAALRAKYAIGDSDRIDTATRAIRRAPKDVAP